MNHFYSFLLFLGVIAVFYPPQVNTTAQPATSVSNGTRKALCSQNKLYCTNVCKGSFKTNTCNDASLTFACECSDKAINLTDADFPVAFETCSQQFYECFNKNNCKQDPVCLQNCQTQFKCGKTLANPNVTETVNAPPARPTTKETFDNSLQNSYFSYMNHTLLLLSLMFAFVTSWYLL